MPWCHVTWFSEILGRSVRFAALLPSSRSGPSATLYLYHGLGGDSSAWMNRSRLEIHAQEWPLLIVMPDGENSFYTDHEQGLRYAAYFAEELPAFVERQFRVKSARAARAAGGLSMGGYGALRVGLGYPDRFCSVHSHSGALRHGELTYTAREARRHPVMKERTAPELAGIRRIFGTSPKGTDHDLLRLARRSKRRDLLPAIHIDCGLDDPLLEDNRRFHQDLESHGIPHDYAEHLGGHDWDYWDLHIREALEFHARALRITRLTED